MVNIGKFHSPGVSVMSWIDLFFLTRLSWKAKDILES
jgi:hypothetical protein